MQDDDSGLSALIGLKVTLKPKKLVDKYGAGEFTIESVNEMTQSVKLEGIDASMSLTDVDFGNAQAELLAVKEDLSKVVNEMSNEGGVPSELSETAREIERQAAFLLDHDDPGVQEAARNILSLLWMEPTGR